MARIAIVGFDFPDIETERALCEGEGHELTVCEGRTPEFIVEHARGADAVISSYGVFTREVFEALAPTLRIVSRTGTGYDEIDVRAATEHGVAVCNVPGYGTEVVSDHAIALALACLRRINEQDAVGSGIIPPLARWGSAMGAGSASSAWARSARPQRARRRVSVSRRCAGRARFGAKGARPTDSKCCRFLSSSRRAT